MGTLEYCRMSSLTCSDIKLTLLFSTISYILMCQCRLATGLIKELKSVRHVRSYITSGV